MTRNEFRKMLLSGRLDRDGGGRQVAERQAARDAMGAFIDTTVPDLRRMSTAVMKAGQLNAYTLEDVETMGKVQRELAAAHGAFPDLGAIVATRLQQSTSWRNEHGL